VDGYRETITDALDALLLVVTGLLAVAMLVAVIGVGNTLTLSVIERTPESALLRALGFTRRQLRQSLAVEGALLAAIGTLLGIALGAVYGWIGAVTVVGDAWPVSLAFPFARIGLVAVVAIGCGLLASVLPSRRAATADPVAALADA
jgi:putative ABC transport system permease protein